MQKSPTMIAFLDNFAASVFAMPRTTAIEHNKCVCCAGDAVEFANALSAKEYKISGMCQKCQDKVFGA